MIEWSPFRKFAPGRRHLFSLMDVLAVGILAGGMVWFWQAANSLPAYDWQWQLLGEFIIRRSKNGSIEPGLLLRGLFTTLRVGFWTFAFSLILGSAIGIISTRKSPLAIFPCLTYINLLRNTPPLVILFVVYFFAGNVLPVAAIEDAIRNMPDIVGKTIALVFAPRGQMDRMIAAIIALGLYQSAYVAEITRGGIKAVPAGQWDAAMALGFGRPATIILVILPQAARIILPPLTGQCISTFKDSALASLISLPDLTFQSLEIMAVSNMTFEIWISAAAIYLLTGFTCACLGRCLERKFSDHIF